MTKIIHFFLLHLTAHLLGRHLIHLTPKIPLHPSTMLPATIIATIGTSKVLEELKEWMGVHLVVDSVLVEGGLDGPLLMALGGSLSPTALISVALMM